MCHARKGSKPDESMYSEVLKAMKSVASVDLGTEVRSIQRTRTHEMILEHKRDITLAMASPTSGGRYPWRGCRETFSDKSSHLTTETYLKVENLDENTDAEQLVTALRQQC